MSSVIAAKLLVHCYHMLGSLPDAEDAVQETLLRAWRYRDSVKSFFSGYGQPQGLPVRLSNLITKRCD